MAAFVVIVLLLACMVWVVIAALAADTSAGDVVTLMDGSQARLPRGRTLGTDAGFVPGDGDAGSSGGGCDGGGGGCDG